MWKSLGGFLTAAVSLLMLAAPANAVAAEDVTGAWLSPSEDNWPLIPIHAVVTPDRHILTYGTNAAGQQTGFFIYDVWDINAGLSAGHATLDNLTQTDLFCSSQSILPQNGTVFLAGGDNWTGTSTTNQGNNNTNLFKYSDSTLTRGANMKKARWYASTTLLPNGEIYIQGGKSGSGRPEVRKVDGTFRVLSNVNTSELDWWYPRNYLAPNGLIFGYDVDGIMYYVDPAGNGQYTSAGSFSSSYAGKTSSAAMYLPGRILQFGGNSNGAIVIDIRGPTPVVTPTASMSTKRMWVSATILADGKVLATGGSQKENQLVGVNNAAEIWNPATGNWTLGSSGSRARLYHSGALLLPDASVLVFGGGAPGPLVNRHAEIYYPPYLYNELGGFRPRPQINDVPSTIDYGVDFSVTSDSTNISRVTLVRLPSVTHSVNMDQRFAELPFTQAGQHVVRAVARRRARSATGVLHAVPYRQPRRAFRRSIVRINTQGSSDPPDGTTTVGGPGGNPFTLECNASEALVGAYGTKSSTYVESIGPRCVPVDSSAHWVGDPVNRGATGDPTGSGYAVTCPRDFAVSGFKAQVSDGVNRVRFECKGARRVRSTHGQRTVLVWAGSSSDGTLVGPYRCPSNRPATRSAAARAVASMRSIFSAERCHRLNDGLTVALKALRQRGGVI
jgi:hypothetical protein